MTTLPQRSGMNAPRTGASAPMVLPSQGGLGSPVAGQVMTGNDIWRIVRANSIVMVVVLAICCAAGWGLNHFLLIRYPHYTATGQVQVQTSFVVDPVKGLATTMDPQQLQNELRTQASLLKTDSLISAVLKNEQGRVRERDWYKQFNGDVTEAKEHLADDFRVAPLAESRLLQVSMTCANPEDAQIIVEEMVNTHLRRQKTMGEARLDEQTKVLNELRRRYYDQMKQYQQDVSTITRRLSEEGMGVVGRLSIKEQELSDLVGGLAKVQSNASESSHALESVTAQIQQGQDPPLVLQAIQEDMRVRSLEQQVDMLKIRRGTLLNRYNEKHPMVLDMDREISETQRALEEATVEIRGRTRTRLVDSLREAASRTQADLESMNAVVNEKKAELSSLSSDVGALITAQEDEKATRELYRQVNDQLRDMQTIQTMQNQSRVEWATHPEIPEVPSFPQLGYTMAAAVAIGLLVSFSIAFLREFMDQTVRSPRDVARVGQMSLLGLIPDESDDPQAVNARLPLVIFEAPHSITAEQFRQVRTRLQHAASLDTTRSIMVTGPSPMDGKTTVACNLAAGLALNGRKILLVDANFRRPELHRIFQVGNDRGFSDVLNGTVNFDDMVRETQVPNLAIMPSGPKPMNPTELFESQLLIDFIERALEEYDHVIFDSGPLLVVSESVAMAPRVDGVVTVVKAHADSRGLLTRMRDTLRQIQAEHLGVILNAVRAQGGGYYRRNIKTYYEYQNGQA